MFHGFRYRNNCKCFTKNHSGIMEAVACNHVSLSRYVDLLSGLAPGTDVEWMAMTQNDAEGEDFTPKCNCSSGSNSAVCKCFAPH